MQNNDDGIVFKPVILARLIYKAIVRYTKAKKSLISMKNAKFGLDFSRIRRGNVQETDGLEK